MLAIIMTITANFVTRGNATGHLDSVCASGFFDLLAAGYHLIELYRRQPLLISCNDQIVMVDIILCFVSKIEDPHLVA